MSRGEARPAYHHEEAAHSGGLTSEPNIDEPAVAPGGETALPGAMPRLRVTLLASHWPIVFVLAAFVVSTFVIPTLANVSIGDDWVYSRSVEILLHEGRLEILDLSVVTLVFQVAWGALFSIFDASFASHRLSTITIVFLSGIAMYLLCRDVGISKHRSALGTAVYLFNPLTFGLTFTFMTDPHYTALLTIAMWLYVRGLRDQKIQPGTVILASAVASLAFLVRQQGMLIPLSVGVYLVLAGRWRPNMEGIRTAVRVSGIPALTGVAYYAWLFLEHGTPEQQGAFLDQIIDAGIHESRILSARVAHIGIAYIGFFVLPLTLAVIPLVRSVRVRLTRTGHIFLALWIFTAVIGYVVFASRDHFMPYTPQYVGSWGIGPTDLQGGRPEVIPRDILIGMTWLVLASTVLFALVVVSRFGETRLCDRGSASLLAMIGVWQAIGVLPPSFHFRNWIITVDRYFLPLVPVVIVLLLWSLKDRRCVLPLAWVVVFLYGAFSVVGTRDMLVFQDATWDMASLAVKAGIPHTALDAGASWDGYFLYEYSIEHGIHQQTVGGPWWTHLFAPATTSQYVVSTAPLDCYSAVFATTYSSWLDGESHQILLLRKNDLHCLASQQDESEDRLVLAYADLRVSTWT